MWFEVILFLLLQPGLLLTIPPVGKQVFMSGKTSMTAIVVHALIFAAILYFKSSIPILRDFEGFRPSGLVKKKKTFVSETSELRNLFKDAGGQMNDLFNTASKLPPSIPKNTPLAEIYTLLANKYISVLTAIRNGDSPMGQPQFNGAMDFLMKLANALDRVVNGGKRISNEEVQELLKTM